MFYKKINMENKKRTIVFGASPNPARYAYKAVHSLIRYGFEAVPVGMKRGEVAGIAIKNGTPDVEEVHTITLYMNPERQKPYYDYFMGLKPQRIIFNPGTENEELAILAEEQGIEVEFACTLVMLSVGAY
jgi:predicted CoA-binding protein